MKKIHITKFISVKNRLDGYVFFRISGDIVTVKQVAPSLFIKKIINSIPHAGTNV